MCVRLRVLHACRRESVGLAIGTITLAFAADYFLRGRLAPAGGHPIYPPFALVAGTASGFTTFVAHAGGPPAQMYLLWRGLDKTRFAGTNLALFTLGNFVKLFPYGLLMWAHPNTFVSAALFAPAVPLGVWAGKWLHDRLEQRRLFFWCYVLLALAAAKLMFDAVACVFPLKHCGNSSFIRRPRRAALNSAQHPDYFRTQLALSNSECQTSSSRSSRERQLRASAKGHP